MAGGVRFSRWRKHEWETWFLGFLLIHGEKRCQRPLLFHTFTPWVPSPSLDVFWVRARRYKAKAQGSVSRGELSPLF